MTMSIPPGGHPSCASQALRAARSLGVNLSMPNVFILGGWSTGGSVRVSRIAMVIAGNLPSQSNLDSCASQHEFLRNNVKPLRRTLVVRERRETKKEIRESKGLQQADIGA